MREKIIFGVLLGIILFGFVSSLTQTDLDGIGCEMLEEGKAEIVGIEIPEQIPYSDEIFNVYIADENFGYLEISESVVSDLGCEENPEATYNVYIKDYSVFLAFETGFTLDKFNSMLGDEIQIKGVGFGKKTKMFFTKIGLKIAGWFS